MRVSKVVKPSAQREARPVYGRKAGANLAPVGLVVVILGDGAA